MGSPSKRIADAWTNEGAYPPYHRAQQERLQREWPTLHDAIVALVADRHRIESFLLGMEEAAPHGPDEPCTCDGCWACKGHVIGCTCDIDWDRLAESNKNS